MLHYIFFAVICVIICMLAVLHSKIKSNHYRKKLAKKVSEANILSELIDLSIEYLSLKSNIDRNEFPIIYDCLNRNFESILQITQNLNHGYKSAKFAAIPFSDRIIDEIANCPNEIRQFMGKQSKVIGRLYKLLHPFMYKLTRIRNFINIIFFVLSIIFKSGISKNRTSLESRAEVVQIEAARLIDA